MINEPTNPTNVSNLITTQSSVDNIALVPRIADALWISATMPWELDTPWEYENDIAYNTPVINQTI
jgi:hypothetical protein